MIGSTCRDVGAEQGSTKASPLSAGLLSSKSCGLTGVLMLLRIGLKRTCLVLILPALAYFSDFLVVFTFPPP